MCRACTETHDRTYVCVCVSLAECTSSGFAPCHARMFSQVDTQMRARTRHNTVTHSHTHRTHAHTSTHSLTHSLCFVVSLCKGSYTLFHNFSFTHTHKRTRSFCLSFSPFLSRTHALSKRSLSRTHTRAHEHTYTHTRTHAHTHTHTHEGQHSPSSS